MVKLAPFDTAHHLDNPQVISAYLNEAMQSGDRKLILRAIGNVVRAGRVSDIARKIGMSRTSLYWTEKRSPEFTTVLKVFGAVGVNVMVEPIPSGERRSARRPSRKRRTRPPSLSRRAESKGHYR